VVAMGSTVEFTVAALGASSLQWFFQGVPIPDATAPTLIIAQADETNLGNYFVRASNGARFVDSRVAVLQFNVTGEQVQHVFAVDKFADAANGLPLQLGATTAAVGAGFAPAP